MTRIFDEDLAGGLATRAIHAGQRPDLTSTYVQESIGVNKGYEYARGKNPTRQALERNVATLEGGRHGFAFGSGMGCLDSIMKLFKAGDHIVCAENVYGGTFRLFDRILRHMGLSFTYVDTSDPQRVEEAMTSATRALLVETPTNPLMRLTDLRAMAEIAGRHDALLVVDNTFATPIYQRPLELGAHIVWHSTTKYINGHSDMIGGLAVVLEDELADRLQFILNAAGAVPGPFDAWLALRGTKTLPLRMKQHDLNGRAIAEYLAGRLGPERVIYPGLPHHPHHELAKRQMSAFGGMMTLDLGSQDNARRFLERVRVFSLAESLGGVESLTNHPFTMTHGSVPAEVKQAMGLTDGMVRLSCGIEDAEDLIEDLEQALVGI
jgi:cystathionine gamma-lyase